MDERTDTAQAPAHSDEDIESLIESISPRTIRHQREIGDLYGWCERTRDALWAVVARQDANDNTA